MHTSDHTYYTVPLLVRIHPEFLSVRYDRGIPIGGIPFLAWIAMFSMQVLSLCLEDPYLGQICQVCSDSKIARWLLGLGILQGHLETWSLVHTTSIYQSAQPAPASAPGVPLPSNHCRITIPPPSGVKSKCGAASSTVL